VNRQELKVVEKICLAMFAEHLLDGLTRKKNYGLVEATRHWQAAKYSPMEYAFIEFQTGTDTNNLVDYLENCDQYITRMDECLREYGTLAMTYEELDALAIQRGEN
jgi:hypothetical protein